MKKHKLILCFSAGLMACLVRGQIPVNISLEQAVEKTLQNNLGLLLAQKEQAQTALRATRGEAGFLPNLTAGGSVSRSETAINQRFVNGIEVNTRGVENQNIQGALQLNWVLYNGGLIRHSYQSFKEARQRGLEVLRNEAENLVAQTMNAYFEAAALKTELEAMHSLLQLVENQWQIMDRKFQLGSVQKQEWLQAKINFNETKAAELSLQMNYEVALANLLRLMNEPADTRISIESDFPSNTTQTLESIAEKMLQNNSILAIAASDKRLRHWEHKMALSQRTPLLMLNTAYNYSLSESNAGFALFNQSSGPQLGLSLNWNLFDGGRVKNNIRSAAIAKEFADIQEKWQIRELQAALAQAYERYKTSLAWMQLEDENIQWAEENLKIATERFSQGSANILLVKEAQRNASEGIRRRSEARIACKRAETELLLLSGTLIRGN